MNPYAVPRTPLAKRYARKYGKGRRRQLPGQGNTALICGLIGLIIPLLGAVAVVMGIQGLSGDRPQKSQAMCAVGLGGFTLLIQVLGMILIIRSRI